MNKSLVSIRLMSCALAVVLIILTFSVIFLANQVNETQKKISNLQSQITTYQNLSGTLQSQINNLKTQINQFQNSTYNVTLTVTSIEPWHGDPMTGYPYYKFINLTLQNYGIKDIGGMTLDFKVEGNTTNIGYLGINTNTNVGVLHSNESINLKVQLIASKDEWGVFEDYNLLIKLLLDKIVLDRKTITLEG